MELERGGEARGAPHLRNCFLIRPVKALSGRTERRENPRRCRSKKTSSTQKGPSLTPHSNLAWFGRDGRRGVALFAVDAVSLSPRRAWRAKVGPMPRPHAWPNQRIRRSNKNNIDMKKRPLCLPPFEPGLLRRNGRRGAALLSRCVFALFATRRAMRVPPRRFRSGKNARRHRGRI